VDPHTDPVGSETFGRIRMRIRGNHSESGQLRIQNEFEVNYSEKLILLTTASSTKKLTKI
jgi:hypothetical protein